MLSKHKYSIAIHPWLRWSWFNQFWLIKDTLYYVIIIAREAPSDFIHENYALQFRRNLNEQSIWKAIYIYIDIFMLYIMYIFFSQLLVIVAFFKPFYTIYHILRIVRQVLGNLNGVQIILYSPIKMIITIFDTIQWNVAYTQMNWGKYTSHLSMNISHGTRQNHWILPLEI